MAAHVEAQPTSGIALERAQAPRARAWLVAGLALWTELGLLLVDRANSQGLVEDISFSPYHLVGYAALAVLGAFVLGALLRALRRGSVRSAFAPGYEGLGIGFAFILGWVILDPVWRDTLGINGLEGALAPTRLLIPLPR